MSQDNSPQRLSLAIKRKICTAALRSLREPNIDVVFCFHGIYCQPIDKTLNHSLLRADRFLQPAYALNGIETQAEPTSFEEMAKEYDQRRKESRKTYLQTLKAAPHSLMEVGYMNYSIERWTHTIKTNKKEALARIKQSAPNPQKALWCEKAVKEKTLSKKEQKALIQRAFTPFTASECARYEKIYRWKQRAIARLPLMANFYNRQIKVYREALQIKNSLSDAAHQIDIYPSKNLKAYAGFANTVYYRNRRDKFLPEAFFHPFYQPKPLFKVSP